MNSSGTYRASLHVSHPTLSAEKLTSSFSLIARYTRSVGAPRVTASGHALGGVYKKTDVSFLIGNGIVSNDDVMVAESIAGALDALPLMMIQEIIRTGGKCFFFLGIYSDGNILCDFSADLLSKLASNGIGVKLDFYGGPELDKELEPA